MLTNTRVALLVVFAAGLAGCGLNQTKPPVVAPTYAQTMQQAQSRLDAHDVDGARVLYKNAANLDPTRSAPWYQLARINFGEQNYGRAIVDAQEVLRRNPYDTGAQSILTIAGLRVAIEALGRLHEETNLQGPAHVEAEKLAAKMRDVLGQDVLVPPQAPRHVRHRVRHAELHESAASGSVTAPVPATPTPQASPPASANPFQALPGSGGD
jgi:Tfp pilus assembly protein PilF